MEINRHLKPVPPLASDAPAAQVAKAPTPAETAPARAPRNDGLPVERLQEALRSMPDVDMERIAEIRQALANGELDTSTQALAASILAFHRGHDR